MKLHCDEEIEIVTVYLCFLVCMHFTIGCKHHSGWCMDLRKVSNSAGLISLSLSMCIDAPESPAISNSSGDFEVGAGVTLGSTEEYVSFSAFLS